MASNQHTSHKFTRKLICVNYPVIVDDVDKTLETCGGLGSIEKAVSQKSNLELWFHPQNKYSKPAVSDTDKKTGLLVKVTETAGAPDETSKYNCEVIGVNALSYSFNKYFDFQYLPIVADEEKTKETAAGCIYHDILPDKHPDDNWLSEENVSDMQIFTPAAKYSRFDVRLKMLYRQRAEVFGSKLHGEVAEKHTKKDSLKQRSFGNPVVVFSEEDEVPLQPSELSLQMIESKISLKSLYIRVKELFEARPIWTKSEIVYLLKGMYENLKYVLPAVAYFYRNGPWRTLWIKYGYDPRKHPESRIYQAFDYRVRAIRGLKEVIKTKRKKTNKLESLDEVVDMHEVPNSLHEGNFCLKSGILPQGRQIVYQYMRLEIPEIQLMLNRLPPVLPGTKCDPKNGWLPNKFSEQCREIVNKYVEEEISKRLEEQRRKDAESNVCEVNNPQMMEASDGDSSDSDILFYSDNSDDDDDEEIQIL